MRYKEVLKKYGVTQTELAERLHMNRVSVSRMIADGYEMKTGTIKKFADAIGCSVGELFDDYEEPSPGFTCPHCGKPINVKLETCD